MDEAHRDRPRSFTKRPGPPDVGPSWNRRGSWKGEIVAEAFRVESAKLGNRGGPPASVTSPRWGVPIPLGATGPLMEERSLKGSLFRLPPNRTRTSPSCWKALPHRSPNLKLDELIHQQPTAWTRWPRGYEEHATPAKTSAV